MNKLSSAMKQKCMKIIYGQNIQISINAEVSSK